MVCPKLLIVNEFSKARGADNGTVPPSRSELVAAFPYVRPAFAEVGALLARIRFPVQLRRAETFLNGFRGLGVGACQVEAVDV
jgi:hypothetical protein